eukprot:comp16851_c0_seq1/m.15310 comp16851_c0_seq1/g.15310  ORF comp16851_c0_seq1/g.15310 comp16851_c0_seq1/m.15310 type:complete len:772 (-) comp16851_c0_seq1:315-2630(-)
MFSRCLGALSRGGFVPAGPPSVCSFPVNILHLPRRLLATRTPKVPSFTQNLFPSTRTYNSVLARNTSNMAQFVPSALQPPTWEKRPHKNIYHGKEFEDPYHWVRNKKDPVVIEHVQRENEYTKAMLGSMQPVQDELYKEFVGRLKEDDDTPPFRRDDYTYYQRTEKGKEYSIYCRKDLAGTEEVLLDVNELAEDHSYCTIGAFRVSPNHKLVAYTTDYTGDEKFVLAFKNLETGVTLEDRVEDVYYSLEWAGNSTVFYDKLNESLRAYKAMRHILGSAAETDVCVYEETDDMFDLSIGQTDSGRFVLIESESKNTTEVRYIDAENPTADPIVVQPRITGTEYQVEHIGDTFFIRTNTDGRTNFSVSAAPIKTPGIDHWREVVPYRQDSYVYTLGSFADNLILYERSNCLQKIHVVPVKNAEVQLQDEYFISFPEPVYALRALRDQDFKANRLRFTYSSPTTPDETYSYDLSTQARTLDKKKEVLGGFDGSQYVCERINAVANDGVEVPISLLYKKGMLRRDGSNPTLLEAYGSYGISNDQTFYSPYISLADRGMVVAVAHIRGGGDNGRQWYNSGKLLHKTNTFTDFVASAEKLVQDKITSTDRLCITGASAGGLLIGATLNLRPDLFKSAVSSVPFVDVINTMMDPTIPLTVQEYEEWGNPNDKEYFDYMLSYSPYDNLKPGVKFPHYLIMAGLHDPRVQYWEPAKYVAKLREYSSHRNGENDTNPSIILLETKMEAGHFGASGRYALYKELAKEYAFIVYTLGAPQVPV